MRYELGGLQDCLFVCLFAGTRPPNSVMSLSPCTFPLFRELRAEHAAQQEIIRSVVQLNIKSNVKSLLKSATALNRVVYTSYFHSKADKQINTETQFSDTKYDQRVFNMTNRTPLKSIS